MTTTNITPDFVQETLVEQLIADLQQGNYVSTAANARNVLRISERSALRPEVLAVAQRTVNILEEKGYSERRFLQEMAQLTDRSAPCPADAVPLAADGTCPPGYFPLFANLEDKTTRRCCGKMQQEWVKMDQEVKEMYNKISDTNDRISFEQRFMVSDPTVKMARDEMVGIGITPHIQHFMERHKQSEIQRLEKKLEDVERGQADIKAVLGEKMTPSLYQRLKDMLGSKKDLAVWAVNHDWTYTWIILYIFRFVALFGCIYLRVADAANGFYDYLKELVFQWWGIKATADYIYQTMMPNIMAVVMGSALASSASMGAIQFGGWLQNVLGTAALTGRLISLFSQAGFVMDLLFVLKDIWEFLQGFTKEVAAQVAGGNLNPLTVASAGLRKGTESYCNQTLCTFFALAANMVGQATKQFFIIVCKFITQMIHTELSNTMCGKIADVLDTVMTFFGQATPEVKPNESIVEYARRMCQTGGGMKIQDFVGQPLKPSAKT